ncbi:hypothetical protein CI610_00986 [invertebrate metagenome]|uniref:Uncharacterized protein n=1 Tax=invertebrate metagenome TaxID=1711999 RepID=A0A2H9TA23_9ZZZZ
MPGSTQGPDRPQAYQPLPSIEEGSSDKASVEVPDELVLDKKGKFRRHKAAVNQRVVKSIGLNKADSGQYKSVRERKIEKQVALTGERRRVLEKSGNGEQVAKTLNVFFLEKMLGRQEGDPDCLEQGIADIAALKSRPEVGETLKYHVKGRQKTSVVMHKKAFYKLNQKDVYTFYRAVLRHCDQRAVLDYVEGTLKESLKKEHLTAGDVKKLHQLAKQCRFHLEHKDLRGSHGHKKSHGTRGIQKLTKRLSMGNELYQSYAEIREQKVQDQKNLSEARRQILKHAESYQIADVLNHQHAGKDVGKRENQETLLSLVAMIAALKDRPEVGMERQYTRSGGRQETSLVVDRLAFETMNQRDIQKFCQEVVGACFEAGALLQIETDLEKMEVQGFLLPDQVQNLRNVIYIRKTELEIYEAWNKTSEMQTQWDRLSAKKQKKLKADVHRSVVKYVEDVRQEKKGKSGKKGLNPKGNLERRVRRTLVGEVGSDAAFEMARAFNPTGGQQNEDYSSRLAAFKKFRKAVNMVNMASNLCTLENKKYRDSRGFFIKHELEKQHGTRFETGQVRSAFRAVGTGPETIFNKGFMPPLLSRLGYQKGLLNEPYVNSSGVADKNVGYTGGVVSMSDSLGFVSEGGYTKTTNLHAPSRWVYLVVPEEAADVSQHLDETADQYALDSQEVMTTYIPPERVVAVREVVADGTMRPMIWNPRFDQKKIGNQYVNNDDFIHFLNAGSVQEVVNSQDADKAVLSTEDNRLEKTADETNAQKKPDVSLAQVEHSRDYQDAVNSRKDRKKQAPLGGITWHAQLAANKTEEMARYIRNRQKGIQGG